MEPAAKRSASELRKRTIQVDSTLWEIPADAKPGMRVSARIVATAELIDHMDDGVFEQVTNVAMLPGVVAHAFCMPDDHWGYGFPISGLAAMDPDAGVIYPGGIGFDINCGMRLVRTDLTLDEIRDRIRDLVDALYERVPAGVGGRGLLRLSDSDFREVAVHGARWCVERGYGWPEDLDRTEERGAIGGADPDRVSPRALERGRAQVGTLGSGNHYLEIQVVKPEDVLDGQAAAAMGLDRPNQIVLMFRCGSRGFGHKIASDYIDMFLPLMKRKFGIDLPDRDLACAPFQSAEGQAYFAAMKCGINMSFANRQVILHRIPEVFSDAVGRDSHELGMRMIYDVAHNTAKLEAHAVADERAACSSTAKALHAPSGPTCPTCPPSSATLASRSSLAAAWRPAPTSCSALRPDHEPHAGQKAVPGQEARERFGETRHLRPQRFLCRIGRGGRSGAQEYRGGRRGNYDRGTEPPGRSLHTRGQRKGLGRAVRVSRRHSPC